MGPTAAVLDAPLPDAPLPETSLPGAPVLVAASHGTSDPVGRAAVAGLVAAVAAARPRAAVRGCFVDVQQPDVPSVLADLAPGASAAVVPLLLAAGYHVHHDLTEAAAASPVPVALARAMGPDARLVEVLLARLAQAGRRAGDAVVLGVAGSSDDRAVPDAEGVRAGLSAALAAPVVTGYLAKREPSVAQAVRRCRAERPGARVVVANLLLAPGYFDAMLNRCGADVVTSPLLAPGEPAPAPLVQLVWDRYDAARTALA